MCNRCRNEDEWEYRHGHKCDDDCLRACDECGLDYCDINDVVEIEVSDGLEFVRCELCAVRNRQKMQAEFESKKDSCI